VTPARIAELLAAADIVVLTSAVEGMPFIVLEALAAGCPVAATNVGDIKIAVHDGVNGVLSPTSDPLRLAERIAVVLTKSNLQPRELIAKTFAEGTFTRQAMVRAYVDMLRDLA
jgi:glycosyltransferase involved in cell wall biosynthesis